MAKCSEANQNDINHLVSSFDEMDLDSEGPSGEVERLSNQLESHTVQEEPEGTKEFPSDTEIPSILIQHRLTFEETLEMAGLRPYRPGVTYGEEAEQVLRELDEMLANQGAYFETINSNTHDAVFPANNNETFLADVDAQISADMQALIHQFPTSSADAATAVQNDSQAQMDIDFSNLTINDESRSSVDADAYTQADTETQMDNEQYQHQPLIPHQPTPPADADKYMQAYMESELNAQRPDLTDAEQREQHLQHLITKYYFESPPNGFYAPLPENPEDLEIYSLWMADEIAKGECVWFSPKHHPAHPYWLWDPLHPSHEILRKHWEHVRDW